MEVVSSRREIIKGGLATAGSLLLHPFRVRSAPLFYRPTDEEQEPENAVIYMWSGALTATSIKINLRIRRAGTVRIVANDSNGAQVLSPAFDLEGEDDDLITTIKLTKLTPDMSYKYWIMIDNILYNPSGSFTTPRAHGAYSFKIAFGNCSQTGSESEVFLDILDQHPLVFMHLGDLHYEDIRDNKRAEFREAYRKVLTSSSQAELLRHTPIVYMWDDHDFGGDNTNSTSKSAEAAQESYRQCVPHFPLEKEQGEIYHSFMIGRIKFVVTDGRSKRDPDYQADNASKTMLGEEQKAWLKAELLKGKTECPLTVWVNNVPWISERDLDTWAGYTTERHEIAAFIEENEIDNIAMLGGDAHIMAIDDGRNNRFGNKNTKLFPVFHAGPLDSLPKYRGGPYSLLAPQENRHYGIMEIVDEGNGIDVFWSGYHLEELEEDTPPRTHPRKQMLTFAFSKPEPQTLKIENDYDQYLPIIRRD